MKIALMSLGTRGDVQPFCVLGKALQQRGHSVTLSSAKNFEQLAASYGLDFVPVEADFQALIDSEAGKQMMKNPFRSGKFLKTLVHPMVYNSLNTFYDVSKQHDKVLFHVKTLADYFADQFPEKLIKCNVVPAIEPTSAFPNPVFSMLPEISSLNKFSYHLVNLGLKMMMKPIRAFRQNNQLPEKHRVMTLPSIYGISNYFLEKPSDYPKNSYYSGFWLDKTDHLDSDIMNFLNEGPPPLLVTFGSMPFETKMNFMASINRMSKEFNVRVIVVKGWGTYDTEAWKQNPMIKLIPSASYYALMPHIKAAIHHGGIGTISYCLQAGKPFLTCPVIYPYGDQHFWGSIAWKKGVGLKPIPLKNLTEEKLIAQVEKLLNNDSLYSNSRKISERLQSENGVLNAVELIEKM